MSVLRNVALFLSLSALWGTAFVAIGAGLAYIPPVLFAAIRYDLAGVLLVAYLARTGAPTIPRSPADWATVGVGALLVIGAYNALLFTGQQTVSSGVAAILIATNPILATVFSRLLLPDERLDRRGTSGLVLGFVGVWLVVRPTPDALLSSDVFAAGLVIGAAVTVALGSVVIQRLDHGLTAAGTVAWSCVLGAIGLHVLSVGLPTETVGDVAVTPVAIAAVVYLAIFASAIGYVVYFDLLARVGAIQINLVSYAAPVFAVLFGWLLLGEGIDAPTLAGFLAITVGFLLIKWEAIRANYASGNVWLRAP